MGYLIMFSVPVILLMILINPKLGTFLIWPILFAYPHTFWFYNNRLPLNIGVDDLFCIFLFIVVLIRRNILGTIPFRFGFGFWVLTSFLIINVIAHLSGFTEVSGAMRTVVIKDALKNIVYWSLFYAILHCIDDERDLKIQLGMFSIAATIGAILVICQHFFPYQFEIFAAPKILGQSVDSTGQGRVSGAFMNPNAAAAVLSCSLFLLIANLRIYKSMITKIAIYGFSFLIMIAILFTQSRAGLLALCGGFVFMIAFSQSRKPILFIFIAALLVGMSFPQVREATKERVLESYNVQTGELGQNVEGRFDIWKKYLTTATAKDYLFGQGTYVASVKTGHAESHSLYISLITVYGIPGSIWAIICLILYFNKAFYVRRYGDIHLAAISDVCIWTFVAWSIYGISSDALSSNYTRYVLFYLVVLVDRLFCFQRQNQMLLNNSYDQNFWATEPHNQ